jgi:hypothetical protein
MVAVSFNARERRLVLDGPCWPGDAGGLADAIREAADPTRGLVLDLTRVSSVAPEVALAITKARCAVEAEGCRVMVWTLPGSATEVDLAAASRGGSVLTATS